MPSLKHIPARVSREVVHPSSSRRPDGVLNFRPARAINHLLRAWPTHPGHARHDMKREQVVVVCFPPPWRGLDPTRSHVAVMPTCHPSTPSSAAAAGEA